MKNFIRYFLQGLVIIAPIAVTLLVIFKMGSMIASLFSEIGLIINPYVDPFIIIAAVLFLIFFVGLLGSSIILKPIFILFDSAIEKAPFIKIIYSSIKDILSAFVGNKKRFNKPVLVTINKESNIQQLGFVTQTDLSELGIKEEKVAVYLPFSYGFSGKLFIVPKENVVPVNASGTDAMKFILSGGVTDID